MAFDLEMKKRLRNDCAEALIMSAEEAAKLIDDGMVVATGLTFSTLVTLFLIPVLFTWLAMRNER